MNFLIGILCFIFGWITSIITRYISKKINSVNSKIKMAERIIAQENKRKEFLKKYDFSDTFKDEVKK